MGALAALALTWVCGGALLAFASKKETRAEFLIELRTKPLETIFVIIWVSGVLGFFWGIMLDAKLHVPTPWGQVHFLALTGSIALGGGIVGIIYSSWRNRNRA